MVQVNTQTASNIRRLPVNGGNLCRLALDLLGDALQWNRIAALNGLKDPILPPNVPFTLLIPPVNASASDDGYVTGGFGLVSAPVNIRLPVIYGVPVLGAQISADLGEWTTATNSPVVFTDISYSYQWELDFAPVNGATGPFYIVQNTDLGQPITISITAKNRGGIKTVRSLPVIAVTGPAQGTKLLLTIDFSQAQQPFG